MAYAKAQGLPTKHPRHQARAARPIPDTHFLVRMGLLILLPRWLRVCMRLNLRLKVFNTDMFLEQSS